MPASEARDLGDRGGDAKGCIEVASIVEKISPCQPNSEPLPTLLPGQTTRCSYGLALNVFVKIVYLRAFGKFACQRPRGLTTPPLNHYDEPVTQLAASSRKFYDRQQ